MRAFDAVPRIAEISFEAARQAGSLALSIVRTAAAPVLAKHRSDEESRTRNWEPPPAPAHVDREAVVVAESVDSGAAGGAGATIRVAQPWDGYDQLKAKDVVAQLATADAAMLAMVRLYESAHRKRRTVLEETDRRIAASGA